MDAMEATLMSCAPAPVYRPSTTSMSSGEFQAACMGLPADTVECAKARRAIAYEARRKLQAAMMQWFGAMLEAHTSPAALTHPLARMKLDPEPTAKRPKITGQTE